MKNLSIAAIIFASVFAGACGGANATSTPQSNKPASETKSSSSNAGASEVVKAIYDKAIKRDCAAIPPMLTEEFRKGVGTSKDSLEALCDSITDSGKVTAISVTGENFSGDAGTIRVRQTLKDGSNIEKEERVKKSADKWLMDS